MVAQYFCTPANATTCSSNIKAGANPSFGTVTELTNTHQGQSNTFTLVVHQADGG